MSDNEEPRSYVAARAQALRAMLHEMGSRELTPEEKAVVAELAQRLRTLLGEDLPAVRVQGHHEPDEPSG
jgi:hypothetical protein